MRRTGFNEYLIEPWETKEGVFLGLKKEDGKIKLKLHEITKTWELIFPIDSREAEILEEELEDVKIGDQIGILNTNFRKTPIIIKKVE